MTKKHFIKIADQIKHHNDAASQWPDIQPFTPQHLYTLAKAFKAMNPNFNRERWLAYIAGECGPNGGAR